MREASPHPPPERASGGVTGRVTRAGAARAAGGSGIYDTDADGCVAQKSIGRDTLYDRLYHRYRRPLMI